MKSKWKPIEIKTWESGFGLVHNKHRIVSVFGKVVSKQTVDVNESFSPLFALPNLSFITEGKKLWNERTGRWGTEYKIGRLRILKQELFLKKPKYKLSFK